MSQTGNLPSGVPKPTETLGYQTIRWCQRYIVQPDGDRAGESWHFAPEQLRFVLWFYAIKRCAVGRAYLASLEYLRGETSKWVEEQGFGVIA